MARSSSRMASSTLRLAASSARGSSASLAAPERAAYVWPMAIGLIGAIVSATVLILF